MATAKNAQMGELAPDISPICSTWAEGAIETKFPAPNSSTVSYLYEIPALDFRDGL